MADNASYDFEDLTDGQDLATNTAIEVVAPSGASTFKGEDSVFYYGSKSLALVLASNTTAYFGATGHSQDQISITFLIRQPASPSAIIRLLNTYNGASSSSPHLDISTTGRWLYRNAVHTTVAALQTATAPSVGDWVLIQFVAVRGTTTSNGTGKLKVTNLTTSTVMVDAVDTAINAGTTAYAGWRMGMPSPVVLSATLTAEIDGLNWSFLTSALLPAIVDNAGADQIVEPWQVVTLTGSGSGPWTQDAGNPTVVTFGGSGAVVTFTAPASMAEEVYTFLYGSDSMTVTILPAPMALWDTGTSEWLPSRALPTW